MLARAAASGRQRLGRRTSLVHQHQREFDLMPGSQLLFELNDFRRACSPASRYQNPARLDAHHFVDYGCSKLRFDGAYLIGSWGDADLDGLGREAAGKCR